MLRRVVRAREDEMSNRIQVSREGVPEAYLIQRLRQKPRDDLMAKVSQVFGGGLVGMSSDGWKLCQQVFDFDYMGNAEYEFGTIPKALQNIVNERADYRAWDFVFRGHEITPGYWRRHAVDNLRRAEVKDAKAKKQVPPRMSPKHKRELSERASSPAQDTTIYVVSHKDQNPLLVEQMIRIVESGKMMTKGSTMFDLDREPGSYRSSETIGWFDLSNEILWFKDKDVRDGFTDLFEIGEIK